MMKRNSSAILYNRLMRANSKARLPVSVYAGYLLIMPPEGAGSFANLIKHFRNLISSILKEGTGVPITNATVRSRAALGLSSLAFNQEEIAKIAQVTKLNETLDDI